MEQRHATVLRSPDITLDTLNSISNITERIFVLTTVSAASICNLVISHFTLYVLNKILSRNYTDRKWLFVPKAVDKLQKYASEHSALLNA